ncbi:MAG: hypothetical protein ABII68_08655 [Pseudomonadota bacterium]
MADIISLGDKLKQTNEEKNALIRKQKILAVRKVFQCTQCAFKCEKCGTQINPPEQVMESKSGVRVPYRFCESCSEEYMDYIERLQGKGDPDRYWHNDDWLDAWKKWIDYQSVMDRYLRSKEFMELLRELKNISSDE